MTHPIERASVEQLLVWLDKESFSYPTVPNEMRALIKKLTSEIRQQARDAGFAEGVERAAGGFGLRLEVLAFAQLMERQLRANDHKPGWKSDNAWSLHERLIQEAEELEATYGLRRGDPQIAAEAADVANFAMMIADVCGALSAEVNEGRCDG